METKADQKKSNFFLDKYHFTKNLHLHTVYATTKQ